MNDIKEKEEPPKTASEELYDIAFRGDMIDLRPIVAAIGDSKHPILDIAMNGAIDGRQMDALEFLEEYGVYNPAILFTSVYRNWPDLAIRLLVRGADIERLNSSGDTPFLGAARLGGVALLEILANRGANVHARNLDGLTALHLAARSSRAEAVRFLLSLGLDPNDRDNKWKETCLHIVDETDSNATSQTSCRETIQLLLRAGADIEALTPDGNAPVLHATQRGRATALDELIRSGADFQKPGTLRRTPLMIAAISNRPESVGCLLSAGADVHAEDQVGDTALNLGDVFPAIVELLARAGAAVDHVDNTGMTPIQRAILEDQFESVRILLKYGASYEGPIPDGACPERLDNQVQ